MKKGHRRVLMKKIGIMKSSYMMGNRLNLDGSSQQASTVGGRGNKVDSGNEKETKNQPRQLDNSISSWLEDQNRMVEDRLAERLTEEQENVTSSPSSSSSESRSTEMLGLEERSQVVAPRRESDRLEAVPVDFPDVFESRYNTKKPLPTDDHGVKRKQRRRLQEMKRAFMASKAASATDFFKSNEGRQYIDDGSIVSSSSSPIDGTADSNYDDDDDDDVPPDFVLDDMAARYSSLDLDALKMTKTRDKELRRLEKIRQGFREKVRNKRKHDFDAPDDVVDDDLSTRYSSLDIDAMDEGTRNKEMRRLDGLKKDFQKRKPSNILEEDEEPLRLDLLKKQDTAMELKEKMRIKDFQHLTQLAAEKEAERRRHIGLKEDEEIESMSVYDNIGKFAASQSKASACLTSSDRRLQAMEQYFDKRRIKRKQQHIDANLKSSRDGNTFDQEDVADLEFDKGFFGEETVEAAGESKFRLKTNSQRRLEATEQYFNQRHTKRAEQAIHANLSALKRDANEEDDGSDRGVVRQPSKTESEECEIDDDECWDITQEPPFDRKRRSQSLATTMPPINTKTHGPIKIGTDDECEIDDEDCWDITKSPLFEINRKSRSLSTTLPPTNTKTHNPIDTSQDDSDYSYDVARDSFPEMRGRTVQSQATASSFKVNTNPSPKKKVDNQSEGVINIGFQTVSRQTSQLTGNVPRRQEVNVNKPFSYDSSSSSSSSSNSSRLDMDAVRMAQKTEKTSEPMMSEKKAASTTNNSIPTSDDNEVVMNICAQSFSRNRATLTGNIPRRDSANTNPFHYSSTPSNRVAVDPVLERDSVSEGHARTTYNEANIASSEETSNEEEAVMCWLLSYLPNLQEEDAVSYFNGLIDQGFDSAETIREVCQEDLSFMKTAHQRVLFNKLRVEGNVKEEV